MNQRIVLLITAFCCFIILACEYHDLRMDGRYVIHLRYTKSHASETRKDMLTGLAWNLSYLGAALPRGSMDRSISWIDENTFALDLNHTGFSQQALRAFDQLLPALRNSHEYLKTGGMDIGRFIVLTLNSSFHYYAITGAKQTIGAFKASYPLDTKQIGILHSSVAAGERLLEVSTGAHPSQLAFIAMEGSGSLTDNSFVAESYEVLDVMPNGQLRFAIYDETGTLKSGADPGSTLAGKPAKCLWCHEINLQRLHINTPPVSGFYSPTQFDSILNAQSLIIRNFRKGLTGDVDFEKTQDHSFGELLYLSFMEPSAERLAMEWDIAKEEVEKKLAHLPTHKHAEFDFLGDRLYHRSEVDQLSPYPIIHAPGSARETSFFEPDLISFQF